MNKEEKAKESGVSISKMLKSILEQGKSSK